MGMKTNKVSKREFAYRAIRKRIVDGRYGPGQRIVIDQLAKELGSSAIPVREAIHQLESEQLLNYVPNVGPVVRSFDHGRYKETLEAVAILEGYATRLAVPSLKEPELQHLVQLNEDMKQSLAQFDLQHVSQLNRTFHHFIYEHCPNALIVQSVEQYRERLNTIHQTSFLRNPKRAPYSLAEHDRLIELITSKQDETEIELFARQHKLNTLESFETKEKK